MGHNLNVPLSDQQWELVQQLRAKTETAAKRRGAELTNWGDVVVLWATDSAGRLKV